MAGRFRGFLERLLGSRQHESAVQSASDCDLLRRFVATRDNEAFELLVWRHGVMVLGVCKRLIGDEHLAEDAFQAVFLVLARKAHSVRGGNLAGWLFRIARRVALRAAHNRVPFLEVPDVAAGESKASIEREELSHLLDDEIARLPHRLRRPVLLCYIGGRSTEDAARELGCPRGTVLSRLSTARKLLAKRLGQRGVALPASLSVVGLELNGRIVSATVAGALRFATDTALLDTASLLANGVIRTMTYYQRLTMLGVVLIATSLLGGVSWVTARGSSGNSANDTSMTLDDSKNEKQGQEAETARGARNAAVLKDQGMPVPEEFDGFVQILELDPVIAKAMKPDPKDTQLRKLQKEVCFNLAVYLAKIKTLVDIGKWNPQDFPEALRISVSFPKNLLELVEKPEDKLKCYDLEVKLLKGIEDFTDTRVLVGTDPSQNRDVAKATRLEAEVKLLKLKLEIEKRKK